MTAGAVAVRARGETRHVRVARCKEILDALVRERQSLRSAGADGTVLEANRLAIVYWQQTLSHALTVQRSLD